MPFGDDNQKSKCVGRDEAAESNRDEREVFGRV